ncbi:MAG: prepilin-type N-terminal cleavage/methylation domain-containing protein [Bradymonadales bacterium]|nr:prepilin-type N-terminal cleavage/methylation domain-containing protein [Bradymonadales bacterium]
MRGTLRRPVCPGASGFTLTEVMVAAVLTSLVVIGTWRFFSNASNSMVMFSGSAILDERLTLASDLLASDVRSAGMFATPNSDQDPMVCPKPSTALRAVQIYDGVTVTGYDYGANVNIQPDQCVFLTALSPHLLRPSSMSGNVIALSQFNLPSTQEDFDYLLDGRLLRITGPSGFYQFVTVTSTDFSSGSLAVVPAVAFLQDNGVCGASALGGPEHEIAVLTHVRYRIIVDPDDDSQTLLVREELRPDLATVVPGTRLIVAENLVDLQCWADRDQGTPTTPSFQPDPDLSDDQGSANLGDLLFNTQILRVFHFRLTGRTDQEYPTVALTPRTSSRDLIRGFDVDGDLGNAALALTVGQEVELSNFVVRNLR